MGRFILLLMEEILHHLGPWNNGINYQPQLVQDFWTINSMTIYAIYLSKNASLKVREVLSRTWTTTERPGSLFSAGQFHKGRSKDVGGSWENSVFLFCFWEGWISLNPLINNLKLVFFCDKKNPPRRTTIFKCKTQPTQPFEKMYLLLKMVIFQPAMLVYNPHDLRGNITLLCKEGRPRSAWRKAKSWTIQVATCAPKTPAHVNNMAIYTM